jgi:UDP-N-acetylmuramyl pentapeptide synthase
MVFRIRPGTRHAAVETGIDHKGQMTRLADVLRPSIAVVTVVGSEHNRSLPTLEATREEKACLVRALPASGVAVLNGDDPNVRWMATQTKARVVTYGFGVSNQVRAIEASLDWPRGSHLQVSIGQATLKLRVRTVGRHQMYPYLATLAAFHAEELPLEPAIQRLEELPATPGAMEIRPLRNGAVMLCDYAKSGFETIVAALDVLAEVPACRRIVALGSVTEPPGPRDRLYLELGERVGRLACRVVILGHDFSKYWRGMRRTNIPRAAVLEASGDILAAARFVAEDLRPGDVVLIKGRGNQRMERIAMALEGRKVRCELPVCLASSMRCNTCTMLDRGWDGLRAVF